MTDPALDVDIAIETLGRLRGTWRTVDAVLDELARLRMLEPERESERADVFARDEVRVISQAIALVEGNTAPQAQDAVTRLLLARSYLQSPGGESDVAFLADKADFELESAARLIARVATVRSERLRRAIALIDAARGRIRLYTEAI